jgi:hypothetical protein
MMTAFMDMGSTETQSLRVVHSDGPVARRADALDYMSHLILELKEMADKADAKMLAGLLALAHQEALRQTKQR